MTSREQLQAVRHSLYSQLVQDGAFPTPAELAGKLQLNQQQVATALGQLAELHILVLEADGEALRMAMPFSAVPTPFRVRTVGREFYGNCMWDALGIPAALHSGAIITTLYADTGEPATVVVEEGRLTGDEGIVHFGLPACRWWEDVVFT